MNKIIKKKWITALRSGKYIQGSDHLEKNGKYCCLGVLCKITGNSNNRDMMDTYPKMDPNHLVSCLPFLGLSTEKQRTLAALNDQGHSFNYIANYIQQNVKSKRKK